MAIQIQKLAATEKTIENYNHKGYQHTSRISISTQIDNENVLALKDVTPAKMIAPSHHKSAIKED